MVSLIASPSRPAMASETIKAALTTSAAISDKTSSASVRVVVGPSGFSALALRCDRVADPPFIRSSQTCAGIQQAA